MATSRCNMECAHCVFSCNTEDGEHTPWKTFKVACDLAEQLGEGITIGGGEPTLHPDFWKMFGYALGCAEEERGLLVVTNGSVTKTALRLAKIAGAGGLVHAALSQDDYHWPIDPAVVAAFQPLTRSGYFGDGHSQGNREIRNVTDGVCNVGAAAENGVGIREACACDDLTVTPDGTLWSCGCRVEAFGTVFDPNIPEDYWGRDSKCGGIEASVA